MDGSFTSSANKLVHVSIALLSIAGTTATIDNIHGTGLETCHVSALNAYKTKRPIRVTGIRTSQVSKRCCLYMPAIAFIFER